MNKVKYIYMYGLLFFSSFTVFSYICYYTDINFPHIRVKQESKEIIQKHYENMLPHVSVNLALGTITLYIFEHVNYNSNDCNFFINFLFWYILADLFFYTIHRTLHTKLFYFLHEKHHEYVYTFGIGAIYSSIPEFILGNMLALIMPAYILKTPYYFNCFIIIYSTFYTTVISHGGYIKSNKHLMHHKKRTCNFGLGIMDRVFNTY